jgi:ATP-dependent DNA helicase PIF1
MANTDMAPCTNPHAVLNYIAKYASKAETKSETYKSMFAAVVRRASSTNPILSATVKMMNALLVERDWPAQEVVHNVLGLPLVVSSRKVVSLDLRREPTTLIEVSNGSLQRRGSSLLEKYLQRATCSVENDDVDLDSLTLLDFARHCEIQPRSNRLFRRPRARPRCVNIFPRYTPDAQGDDYEEFCRVKLMLHHPFLDAGAESLRRASGDSAPTFRFAYEQCLATACHHERDPLDPLDDSENDAISDYEEASEAEDDGI